MPRLFISHSSKDNIAAIAFCRWLTANGWSEEDVFIDLDGIDAGSRWREMLRKANAMCEAVLLLASPDSLRSIECEKELELAEALGKVIIPAILRDLTINDARLARFADRQIADLSATPTERIEFIGRDGRPHRVELSAAALGSIKSRLANLGIAPGSFSWCRRASDSGLGRGRKPAVNIGWDDAKQYADWLSKMTGNSYRLLTEAEFEYAARAGVTTAYSWGDEFVAGKANCEKCGSKWDNDETSPVGSFEANRFGLFDMQGNVWQWVEDCYNPRLDEWLASGGTRIDGECYRRMARAASWKSPNSGMRLATRFYFSTDYLSFDIGFRVARTLPPQP